MSSLDSLFNKDMKVISELSTRDAINATKASVLEKIQQNIDELSIEVKANRNRLNDLKRNAEKLLEENPAFYKLRETYDDLYDLMNKLIKLKNDPDFLEGNPAWEAMQRRVDGIHTNIEELLGGNSLKSNPIFAELKEEQQQNNSKFLEIINKLEDRIADSESRFAGHMESIQEGISRLQEKMEEFSEKISGNKNKTSELEDEIKDLAQKQKEEEEERKIGDAERSSDEDTADNVGIDATHTRTVRPKGSASKPKEDVDE